MEPLSRWTDETLGYDGCVMRIPNSQLQFEIMAPTRPDSFVQKFIATRRAGMHHICCEVVSVDGAAASSSSSSRSSGAARSSTVNTRPLASAAMTSIFAHEPGGLDFTPGTVVFSAGDPATSMWVVQEGDVDLFIGEALVETVGVDGFFGEMGMLESAPRTATAVARTACRIVEIDQLLFTRQVTRNPFFAIEMMRTLARRLRNADRLIEQRG
jgi:CRP/FNR family transcriptional regulator, cyclic AMP receptor protein